MSRQRSSVFGDHTSSHRPSLLFLAALFLFLMVLLLTIRSCFKAEDAIDHTQGRLEQCKADLDVVIRRCYEHR